MKSEPVTRHDSRTLLLDADMTHGGQLIEQLNHAGFKTDFAVSWGAAHAALGANYYHSCIVVADLDQLADREQLVGLRQAIPRVWMIVLSDHPSEGAQRAMLRRGVDAVVSAPFSMHDLTARVAAFSLRSRPTY
jgi:DNA-binding response OmpR family regulator